MGQKNCSIKDEDELAQIIGKYRMTSELHWVDFKSEVDNQLRQTVVKKDSYSSDSLEEYCEGSSSPVTDQSKTSSDENFDLNTNNEKSLSQSFSENSSVHDNNSTTSTYSFEIVEETEALQIDNITEAIDIRISPCNSTVMSFNCANNFYSEFSLVANVEVQIPDENKNFEEEEIGNKLECGDIKTKSLPKGEDILKNEEQKEINEKYPEIQSIDINANKNEIVGDNKQFIKDISDQRVIQKKSLDNTPTSPSACDSFTPKKTGYYANKIEIAKKEKKTSTSVEKKIAEEIKEMKQREEDLRSMREKLAKEISEKVTAKNVCSSEVLPDQSMSDKVASSPSDCDQKPVIKAVTRKAENTNYVKACVFAIKKKDPSVKNDVSETKSPCAITPQETPVQREIRIAKEREEELRREREQALKSKMEMDSFISESANETDADSALSICSDSSFDSVSKLAPLFPRTVSPELSNSNGISMYSSSTGSVCSLDSLSQREKQTTGSQSIGGSINDSVISLSPDSAYCKPGFPFASSRISAEKRSKSVDMERFISSKGKELKFKGEVVSVGSYYEIKPPQIKKGEEMTCKRFVTAAAKIQNELKEMQEREEQFKRERANLQQEPQNVKNMEENGTILPEDNSTEREVSPPPKINQQDSPGDSENISHKKQENSARRRSILIDEWELRIQKSSSQS